MIKPIILIVVVVLIGLVVLAIFLPSQRQATKSFKFPFSCDEVWKVYSDAQKQPEWRSGISSVEMLSDAPPRKWVESPQNGPSIEFTETSSTPGSEIVLDIRSGTYFQGTYTARFEQSAEGCTGTFTESVELLSPISKLMSYAFFSPGKSIEKYAKEATSYLEKTIS